MVQELTFAFGVVMVGYMYEANSNYSKIKMLTSPNNVILYESVLAGILFHFYSWVGLAVIKWSVMDCSIFDLANFRACSWESMFPFYYFDVLVGAIFIAGVRFTIENVFHKDEEAKEKAVTQSGLIPSLIFDVIRSNELVLVETFRRKAYAGCINLAPGISTKGELMDIAILPLFSGYRDDTTQKLELPTYYGNVIRELKSANRRGTNARATKRPGDDLMSVYIPVSDIAAIRLFSEEVHGMFSEKDTAMVQPQPDRSLDAAEDPAKS